MSEMAVFKDVILDSEPIGLAETMESLSGTIEIRVGTDSQAKVGEIVFFGLPTPAGEILEVKGLVKSESPEGDCFRTIEVLEVDSALKPIALPFLKGRVGAVNTPEKPIWGIGLKQTNQTYAILVNCPAGVLSSDQLGKLAELSRRGAGMVKLTHAQRIILLVPLERTEEIRSELEAIGLKIGVLHKGVRNVRACCGTLCRFSQGTDAISVALATDKALYGRSGKFDIKIAISDCQRNCSESYCCDIGLIGDNGKYIMVVGGRGSQIPFRALRLVGGLDGGEIPGAIGEVVVWYERNALEGERLWKLLVRLGEASTKGIDLVQAEKAFQEWGDGVDEGARLRDQLARMAGLKVMKAQIGFCKSR